MNAFKIGPEENSNVHYVVEICLRIIKTFINRNCSEGLLDIVNIFSSDGVDQSYLRFRSSLNVLV